MGIKVVGRGDGIVVRVIEMDTGSPARPWIVFKSDDAGIWPIESHKSEASAQASADALDREEDERCAASNARRKRQRKRQIERYHFDEYFVRHREDPDAPLL
jgi:hypothetical protein